MAWKMAVAALAAAAGIAAAPAQDVTDLGWLSGSWVSGTEADWTEEMWMPPRGGLLLGTNRSGKGAKGSGFEYMRIAADESGKISFWASPAGRPGVEFPLTSLKPGEAVFENARHDYPTRIVYRREGETLVGTISGPGGKDPVSWTFRRPQTARTP